MYNNILLTKIKKIRCILLVVPNTHKVKSSTAFSQQNLVKSRVLDPSNNKKNIIFPIKSFD